MLRNIIGICGRKESGKSVIGSVCKEYGYEVIRFAEPLKLLISNLIKVDRKDLDALKTVEREYTFNNDDFEFISNETSIPINFVSSILKGNTYHTVRDLLQVIGTDLIRKYNINWHVDKTREYVESNKNTNFLIDDVRFPNEVDMIRELGGTCWFIIRPKLNNISNHISETALKWQDFDNLIVNDKDEETLRQNWESFMSKGYKNSLNERYQTLDNIIGNKELQAEMWLNEEYEKALATLFISKYEFSYRPKFLYEFDGKMIIDAEGHLKYVKYGENTIENIENPFEIEDLKKFVV